MGYTPRMNFWKPLWVWLWGVRGQQESWREKPTTTAGADTTQFVPIGDGLVEDMKLVPVPVTLDTEFESITDITIARFKKWYVTDEWPPVPEEELRKRKANKCE